MELKNCESCHIKPELIDMRLHWYVECKGCGQTAMGARVQEPKNDLTDEQWQSIEDTAVLAWNITKD